jgi:exonuclease VII large subunit
MEHYQELRKKQTAHMQEMQALREKLHQAAANDPEEWQRLMGEMQRLRDEMRQQMQEQREKMRQEGGMMPGGPYSRGPSGRFGPRWGGPNYGPGPYFNRPYRGGPGWMPGGPGYDNMPYDNRGGMPDMPGPDYDMPYGGMPDMPGPSFNMPYDERGGMPGDPSKGPGSFRFNKNRPLGHYAKMEQSLENIEKLLEQVVELLKDKD